MTSLALATAGFTPCPTYDLGKRPDPLVRQIVRHVSLYLSLAIFNIACSIAAAGLTGSWANSHLFDLSSAKATIASAQGLSSRQ